MFSHALLKGSTRVPIEVLNLILQHHECIDGSGYPKGLKDRDAHYLARVIRIVDVFNALVSARPYRYKYTPIDAAGLMAKDLAKKVGTDLFQQFIRFLGSPLV